MQLQEQYPDVHVVSLNVDFDTATGVPSPELHDQVLAVLRQQQVTCDNVLASTPMEQVFEEFGVFALPAVLILDRKGQLYACLEGKIDYETELLRVVAELTSRP